MISDIGDLKISLGQVKSHSGNSSSIVFICTLPMVTHSVLHFKDSEFPA